MVNNLNKILLLVSALFLCVMVSSAQSDCGAALKKAVEMYDKGQYDKVLVLLADKIDKCKFVKIEKEQALKILASAYYDLDELEKGNKYMNEFLKMNPNYHININQDPIPFMDAYDRFLVRPKFSFSIALGLNFTNPQIDKSYSVWEAANYTNEYETVSGSKFTLGFQYNFMKDFSLNTELNILGQTFIRNISSPVYTNFNIRYEESLSGIMFPLYLKYSFKSHKKFFPEIYAGVLVYQPVSPAAKINVFGNFDPEGNPRELDSEPSIALDDFRNLDGSTGLLYGVRMNYHKNNLNLFVDWRYAQISGDYVNKDKRYQNDDLLNDFYFIDDDIKLRHSSISIGLNYIFSYKVKYKY